MKGFIEFQTENGRVLVNIATISYVKNAPRGGTEIGLLAASDNGHAKLFYSSISVEDFKKLITDSSN